MTAAPQASRKGKSTESAHKTPTKNGAKTASKIPDPSDDEDEDDQEEDEPQLKYTKLTGSLSSVYRNGDDTSSFFVAGDKMVRCLCTTSLMSTDICSGHRNAQRQHCKYMSSV